MLKNLFNKKKEELAPDLEKERDDRCIPVARGVLKEMAGTLVASDASQVNYNDLMLKTLSAFLDADLNLTTDTPYVPQLLLGVLAGLNRSVHLCKVIEIDDARYSEIASKILTIVSEANVTFGEITPEQSHADFVPVIEKLNDLFAEEKLTTLELKYIMDNIFDAFKEFSQKLDNSITDSTKRAEQKLFGVEFMEDISMKRLNEVLIKK